MPFTGIAQYTKNLFAELAREDKENTYILAVHTQISNKIRDEFPDNVEIKVLPERKFPSMGMRKTWWEQILLPAFFQKEKVDIAFFTYPSNPWDKKWYKKGIKTAVTVHDCIPWVDKNYRRGILSKMYHSKTKKAVKLADIVFTVSKTSAEEISRVCKVDIGKIKVAYNDASQTYKNPLPEEYVESVLQKFDLKKNGYFLYAGGYDKRKNVEFLLREHGKFGKLPLVMAGGKLHYDFLYSSFDSSESGKVVRTGFLEEKDLAALYRGALAFINLSYREGFNITILEAANCETPMILSNIPVHREVAGDCALFADISREGGTAEAMQKILSENVRIELTKKGLELAEKYSVKKSAQKVKNVLFS